MKLTKHFQLEEFTRSVTADLLGIDNTLNPESPYDAILIGNLRRLCEQVLEPLRAYANVPLYINSGYRSMILNRALGGAPYSNHISGCAADLRIPDESTGRDWFRWLQQHVKFDELIWESETPVTYPWIHIALKPEANRQKVLPHLVKQR
ncbi:MAG: D-Ala-D-Ala carboxypeptidase family metallohydrolase [Bacteroides sp.]